MDKILVVDDVKDNITLLSFELEDDGFEVLEAYSGDQCLEFAASKNKPALILLDIYMPGKNGLETLQALKSDPKTEDIPVIMVSAADSDDNIVEAIDLGAHDFVRKPIDYPVLAARMRSALRLAQALADLEIANEELNKLATQDSLTGCYNRRQFFNLSEKETEKATRHKRSLALMMFDLDHFKHINDNHGHAAGDKALIAFVECLRNESRNSDIIGRLGGEEFAVCCPDADLRGAKMMAERIRTRCAKLEIATDESHFKITVSIGVTLLSEGETFDHALHRADLLLYQAKNTGRNKSIAALDTQTTSH